MSTGCCCVLTPPGPPGPLWASRTPSPEGFIPTPHLPPAPVAANSLDWASFSLPWSPATDPTVCWYHSLGAGSTILGEAPAHCAALVLTLMNQLFLVNGTKTLPQVINSPTKSLNQPLEAFRVWLSDSNHSPRRYPQACGKDYQQWLSPLLHPARKGPFTAWGTCSPGEPQAKGCTCTAPGPNPEHHPNSLQ